MLAAASFALPLAVQAATLEDVRVWAGPDATRVVFDLDSAAKHNLFMLENPARVVIDVEQTQRKQSVPASQDGRGAVKRVRSGNRGDHDLRLVLDLAGESRAKSFILKPQGKYGHRLVVDVEPLAAARTTTAAATLSTPSEPVALGYKPIVIAIDAGHGGEDSGARGPSGVLEKHVALQIARRLAKLVDNKPGMKAVLVRDGDYYVGLRTRIAKAREAQADLFISIHADAFTDRRVHGSSIYVLSERGASSEHARTLAKRENESDLIGGVRLDDKDDILASVLIDISQTAALEASFDVGARMLSQMGSINKLHKKAVQQAGFAVLKAPDIPSVLVETAFISNRDEERRLKDPGYQQRMAQQLMRGIEGYFEDYRPRTTVAGAAPRQHTVSRGDTLSQIAQRYRTSMRTIRDFNGLASDSIRVGDVIQIPPT
ncbi:AMIN domain-containing protein [bacterium]|nr:AMIN domain-containing protein [bacterium]